LTRLAARRNQRLGRRSIVDGELAILVHDIAEMAADRKGEAATPF